MSIHIKLSVIGAFVVLVALGVFAISMQTPTQAQTTQTISNGDVIALVGTGDIYVVVVEDTTRTKRHFVSPEAFEAYTLRSWNDVIYVSQEVFDRYTTATSLSSVAGVSAFMSAISSAVAPPTQQPATPTTPPTQTGTGTQTISNGDVIALIGSNDIYVVVIDGATQVKRHITSPEVFEAYTARGWSDVMYVSQAVFDSYATATSVSTTTEASAPIRPTAPVITPTPTGTPTDPPTQPILPPTPPASEPTPQPQQSRNRGSSGGGGGIVSVIPNNKKLDAPSNFRATSIYASSTPPASITLEWERNKSAKRYEVQWCSGGGCTDDDNWAGTKTFNNNTTTKYTIPELSASLTYKVRIRSLSSNTKRNSEWGEIDVPVYPIPNVANIAVGTKQNTAFDLSWDAITLPQNSGLQASDISYVVRYRVQGLLNDGQYYPEKTTSTTSITLNDLEVGTQYDVWVKAEVGANKGNYGSTPYTTNTGFTGLKITGLKVTGAGFYNNNGFSKIQLEWDAPAGSLDWTTYKIEHKNLNVVGAGWVPVISTDQHGGIIVRDRNVGSTGCDITNDDTRICAMWDVVVDTKPTSTPERYWKANKVRALLGNGMNAPSIHRYPFYNNGLWEIRVSYYPRHADAQTSAYPQSSVSDSIKVAMPTLITSTPASTSIALEWNTITGTTPDSWKVQYCTGLCESDNDWNDSNGTTADKAGDATKKTNTITGLTTGTSYKVRVKPVYTTDETDIMTQWSTAIIATTS